jgi:lipoprotein-anchoring transpeptidase ErfK/SrfK
MRRLVTLPIKTSAVTITILAGALLMAAEARQAVVRHRETDLAGIIEQAQNLYAPVTPAISTPAKTTSPLAMATKAIANTALAKEGTSRIAAVRPTQEQDGHRRHIIVSIPDRRLALLEDGTVVKTYPIAVGARVSPSPEGDFAIINHAVDPVYRHKGKEIQPGQNNPLGSRWMGLSLKGYGIHGTNVPSSIGKAASHGCFRMHKEDVEDLYRRVQVGDTVTIRNQRDELIARVFPTQDLKPAKNLSLGAQIASASTADLSSTTATTTGQ